MIQRKYYILQGVSLRERHTPPTTLAQEGNIDSVKRDNEERSMLDCKCKLAT